jgi:hypothetical protein
LAVLICLAAILVSCGGGSTSVAGVGSGGTGASFSGPITGFGSIIVNGVRIDDSSAQITLDDDRSGGGDLDLKLGMVVDVEGERSADGTTGTAFKILTRSVLQGPISAIDAGQNRLTVLGVTVIITSRTVFDGAGVTGLGALNANDAVEIYGIPDQQGKVKATRIERVPASSEVRMTGIVQPGAGASTFRMNDYTVQYEPGDLMDLPNGVTAGMRVRVKGSLSGTTVQASSVRLMELAPSLKNSQHAEMEGVVTRFVSATEFDVNGIPVKLGPGVKVEGSAASVAVGRQVEVEGRIDNQVLVASNVAVEDDEQKGEKEDAFEVHGDIDGVDLAAGTFTMRRGAITVKWDDNTRFDKGSLASRVAAGKKVKVKGKMNGNVLVASIVEEDA